MKLYTSTSFEGHWPVGVSAIILADDIFRACDLLSAELKNNGLKQKVTTDMLKEVQMFNEQCIILNNGDY